MRQMSGKKRVVMTGISSLLVAGLVVGNIEYATHTYRYDSKVQAMAANNKVVEQTASFASSKKKRVPLAKRKPYTQPWMQTVV